MASDRLAQFRRRVEIDPNEVTFSGRGRPCLDAGERGEAVRVFRRVIEFKPDSTAVDLLLGERLQELGARDEALDAYERGVAVAKITRDEIPGRKMEKRVGPLEKG